MAMLTETDLNGPAQLHYEPAATGLADSQINWNGARAFASLREALHWAMTAETPAGQAPFIRASSGFVLRPEMLEGLWSSLQGP
jgi:hypothetical protein